MIGVKTKDKNESLVYDTDKILWEDDKAVGKKTLYLNSPSGALVGYKYDTDRRNVITDLIGSVRRIYTNENKLNNYFNFDMFGNTTEQGAPPEIPLLHSGAFFNPNDKIYIGERFYIPPFGISNQNKSPHMEWTKDNKEFYSAFGFYSFVNGVIPLLENRRYGCWYLSKALDKLWSAVVAHVYEGMIFDGDIVWESRGELLRWYAKINQAWLDEGCAYTVWRWYYRL